MSEINALDSVIDFALKAEANAVISEGLDAALSTMENMIGNAGQQTVYNDYVIDAFKDTRSSTKPGDEWEEVDIGEYMDFMGEIVGEGNDIMSDACDEAADIVGESGEFF